MSQENVQLAERWVDAWNRGGFEAVVDEYWQDEIELLDPPELPDADRYVGKVAVRQRVEGFLELGVRPTRPSGATWPERSLFSTFARYCGAMSQENVETVRRAADAFNRRDPKAFADLCVQEVEILPLRAAMEGTVYRGHDAVSRFFAESDEAWEDLRIEELEARDLGDGVLAFATLRARGRTSGAPVDMKGLGLVFHFRDGLITAAHTYLSREEALNATGLSE